MEAWIFRVFHQLDPGPPRVEDEADLEQPRDLTDRRPVGETLEPHARPLHPDLLEGSHLGAQIGEREPDVVDPGALGAPLRRLDEEHELDLAAARGVSAIGDGLAFHVPDVPADRLRRTRCRNRDLAQAGVGGARRLRSADEGGDGQDRERAGFGCHEVRSSTHRAN